MDDNNLEIKRIQDEIERDLQALKARTASVEAMSAAETAMPVTPVTAGAPIGHSADISVPQRKELSDVITIQQKQAPGWSFKRVIAVVCVAAILGGAAVGGGIGLMLNATKNNGSQTASNTPAETPAAQFTFNNQSQSVQSGIDTGSASTDTSNNIADIVDRIIPSVVGITMIPRVSASQQDIQNYFGNIIPGFGSSDGATATPAPDEAQGSGIIFSQDNDKVYIVTNNHVVSGASSVTVSVEDKDAVSAKLVGESPSNDLAVIYILKSDLAKVGINSVSVANFGDSDAIRVGEAVIAIGNAMGEGNTVTNGIVSAKNKQINVEDINLNVIQTNAAINPGNSGGPLVDMNGDIIGINTAKLSTTVAEGMGYSITSNDAKATITDLMNSNQGPQALLGIIGYDITQSIADAYNLPLLGVVIDSVEDGTAAADAGLQANDIITGFDGATVTSMTQLSAAVKACKVGQKVEVKILRDGQTPMTINVTLGANDGF